MECKSSQCRLPFVVLWFLVVVNIALTYYFGCRACCQQCSETGRIEVLVHGEVQEVGTIQVKQESCCPEPTKPAAKPTAHK